MRGRVTGKVWGSVGACEGRGVCGGAWECGGPGGVGRGLGVWGGHGEGVSRRRAFFLQRDPSQGTQPEKQGLAGFPEAAPQEAAGAVGSFASPLGPPPSFLLSVDPQA